MRHYNRQNCQACVRNSFIDKWGRTVTLLGQHAFQYSIWITDKKLNKSIALPFLNGKIARKEFNKLKLKK